MNYDPRNWYWLADDGRVFSSARSAEVTKDDPSFKAWRSAGFSPTRWPADDAGSQSDEALQDVLTPFGLFVGAASLATALIAAGTSACTFVDQQVVPDETHRTAYTNAATIVFANGGKAPTADPAKSIFAAQAASLGLTADVYAAVVQEVALVSLQLATILSTLRSAVGAAKSGADLATALTAFETAIGALVTALNGAGLTITVAPPPVIVIVGING